jgi:hypothetical protein
MQSNGMRWNELQAARKTFFFGERADVDVKKQDYTIHIASAKGIPTK